MTDKHIHVLHKEPLLVLPCLTHSMRLSLYMYSFTPFALPLHKIYIHLHQQLKLYGKYTSRSTSTNFIDTNKLSTTLFAYVLTFNSINR